MNNDLISIIMATYNPKNTEALYKSVNSILNQTHKNIEFLICDDGSNSATKTLLEEIQQLDDRIKAYGGNPHLLSNLSRKIFLCVALLHILQSW